MSKFKRKWEGSVDFPDGVAVFCSDDVEYRFRLINVQDFMLLSQLLETAFQYGVNHAEEVLRDRVTSSMYKVVSELSCASPFDEAYTT